MSIPKDVTDFYDDVVLLARQPSDDPNGHLQLVETKRKGSWETVYVIVATRQDPDDPESVRMTPVAELLPYGEEGRYMDPNDAWFLSLSPKGKPS